MLSSAILLLILPHGLHTSRVGFDAAATAEVIKAGDIAGESLDELYLQEYMVLVTDDVGGEIDALSLVQMKAMSRTVSKQSPQSEGAAAGKTSKRPASSSQRPAAEPNPGMIANMSAAAPQKLKNSSLKEMAPHISPVFPGQLGNVSGSSGLPSERSMNTVNVIIVIAVAVMIYCCLVVHFIPDPRSEFSPLRIFDGASGREAKQKEEAESQSGAPAGESVLRGYSRAWPAQADSSRTQKSSPPPLLTQQAGGRLVEAPPIPAASWAPQRSLEPGMRSPRVCQSSLCPSVMLPPTHRLLLPVDISDGQCRGPFEIIWSADEAASSPRLSLQVQAIPGCHTDMLELAYPRAAASSKMWLFGSSRRPSKDLCASVGPAQSERLVYHTVDNKYAQSDTPGVAYRASKDLRSKIKSSAAVVPWGTVIAGSDEGDGWLRVGDRYLPMVINGMPVIVPTSTLAETPQDKFNSVCIYDHVKQPCATMKVLAKGNYKVEQNGVEIMSLTTGNPDFQVEVTRGAERLAGVVHDRTTWHASGRSYMELLVEPVTDPVLVLMCSLAVLREVVVSGE